ncbi:MAG: glycosyltransferase family 9 protein [Opitutales bacterium]
MGNIPQKILIVKPSSMGDIVHGLLIAESIRKQLPDANIDWVVRREFAPLVDSANAINKTYIFKRDGGISAFIKLLKEVRRETYDIALDMQGLARSAIITKAAHAGLKIGRPDAREGAGLSYHKTTAMPTGKEPCHAVEILTGFLTALELEPTLPKSVSFSPPKDEIELIPMHGQGKRLLLFPESRRAEKNWLGYEALTRELLRVDGIHEVIWCGHIPFEAGQAIIHPRFRNLCGQTNIGQLSLLMQRSDCIVSNDSGPMHLAAALDRPLVTLFGPTDPRRFGPFPSAPEQQRIIRREDGNLGSITVEEVHQAILDVLRTSVDSD